MRNLAESPRASEFELVPCFSLRTAPSFSRSLEPAGRISFSGRIGDTVSLSHFYLCIHLSLSLSLPPSTVIIKLVARNVFCAAPEIASFPRDYRSGMAVYGSLSASSVAVTSLFSFAVTRKICIRASGSNRRSIVCRVVRTRGKERDYKVCRLSFEQPESSLFVIAVFDPTRR